MGEDAITTDLGPAAPMFPGGINPAATAVKRSPFGFPRLPKATQALFDQIRAKAKQALPAAPVSAPTATATPWVKYGLIGVAVFAGFKLLGGKKGRVRHG